MNIYIFGLSENDHHVCVGIIDEYKSFNYTKKFLECGSWTLKGNYSKHAEELLKPGRLMYVRQEICGYIHTVDWQMDDDGSLSYTCYGKELKDILNYRIVWDIFDYNLPTNKWIERCVRDNCYGAKDYGDRTLFSKIEQSDISCPNYDKQVSYKPLGDTVSNACKSSLTSSGLLLGYEVVPHIGLVRTTQTTNEGDEGFTFQLVEGKNRAFGSDEPVIISRYLDNVSNLEYADSIQKEANVVMVAGQGEGTKRAKYTVSKDSKVYSYLHRKEVFVDARDKQQTYTDADGNEVTVSDADYKATLIQEAKDNLQDETLLLNAETQITPQQGLELLGAKVSVVDVPLGLRTDDFVTAVNFIDEADGNITTLSIGKDVEARYVF